MRRLRAPRSTLHRLTRAAPQRRLPPHRSRPPPPASFSCSSSSPPAAAAAAAAGTRPRAAAVAAVSFPAPAGPFLHRHPLRTFVPSRAYYATATAPVRAEDTGEGNIPIAPEATPDDGPRFIHATAFLPHPEKGAKGEDAYFATDNNRVLGVADGVGGWVELGIDAGAFSRELMGNAKSYATSEDSLDPGDILHDAYFKTTALGTCTACLVSLDGGELKAINVGDSGFSVLRRLDRRGADLNAANGSVGSNCGDKAHQWALFFETTEQTHFFNCPFQLGTNSKDSPADGQSFTIPVLPGDIVILATDGLLDNIFTAELIQVRCWCVCVSWRSQCWRRAVL